MSLAIDSESDIRCIGIGLISSASMCCFATDICAQGADIDSKSFPPLTVQIDARRHPAGGQLLQHPASDTSGRTVGKSTEAS